MLCSIEEVVVSTHDDLNVEVLDRAEILFDLV